MIEAKIYTIQLTHQEAHVILRALATHSDTENRGSLKPDVAVCKWLAERILREVAPELGACPIDAIYAKAEESFKGKGRRIPK